MFTDQDRGAKLDKWLSRASQRFFTGHIVLSQRRILVFVLTKLNDSEAACFGAEALKYHCSVCEFVRLAVRPVNSDIDIFIRILFYLNNK